MIEKAPTASDLAVCMGYYTLSVFDSEKLDTALRVLREVTGEESTSTLTKNAGEESTSTLPKNDQILKLCESINEKLDAIKGRLEKGEGKLTAEEEAFVDKVSGIKDKLTAEVKEIDEKNIEIFKSSTGLGKEADNLTVLKAIHYANDLKRAKVSDPNYRTEESRIINTKEGPVHKGPLELSSNCYDTAFSLVAGVHYSSLLTLQEQKGCTVVVVEINRVGGAMFEALKTYLKEKHGEGAILHLSDEVKSFWIGSFRENLISKLNE